MQHSTPMTDEQVQRAQDARIVGEALDWAYRQGYSYGEKAAEAFARMEGLVLAKEDLGQYGDMLVFKLP